MRRKGFTLIELLIVVAIIAILAAIAVPNFLEAQVRSKVSRVKNDLRAVATANEAYCVDYNKYVDHYDANGVSDSISFGYMQYMWRLTTPVAYMTSVMLVDPFTPERSIYAQSLPEGWARTYWYMPYESTWGNAVCIGEFGMAAPPKGWTVHSYGPDRIQGTEFNSTPATAGMSRFPFYYQARQFDIAWNMIYDPTNGTRSLGDVGRFGGNVNCPTTPGW